MDAASVESILFSQGILRDICKHTCLKSILNATNVTNISVDMDLSKGISEYTQVKSLIHVTFVESVLAG